MTAEGAYRKATSSLTFDMMQFDAEEDGNHASELLPHSSQPDVAQAVVQPSDADGADPPSRSSNTDADAQARSPLKAVRYASLTAPGPSGMRAEHIRDILSAPRRRDANRLLRALATLHTAGLAWGSE